MRVAEVKRAVVGPMCSGKSSWLIRKKLADPSADLFRFRYGQDLPKARPAILRTHGGESAEGYEISEFQHIESARDTILIDEIQFGNPDALEAFLRRFHTRSIYVAGLDMDYMGRPFVVTGCFLCLAQEVEKLLAVCSVCGGAARHTSNPALSGSQFFEGTEGYMPMCLECYRREGRQGTHSES